MAASRDLYNQYKNKFREIADLKYASAVLQWDQETYLPSKGNEMRGRQIATLNELAHQKFTDERTGSILQELLSKNDLTDREKRNVQLSYEDFEKNKKLPVDFVRKMTETSNKSFHAWISARKQNSFEPFRSPLDELIELKRQEADYLGYEKHPYDALMNDYDKGLTVEFTDQLFAGLMPELTSLLQYIQQKPEVDAGILRQHFERDAQWKFGMDLLKKIHFDFEAGRQDISEHPFTVNFNSQDVRITTRIDEHDFGNMTWSCIHEAGHALYEQGLSYEEYGLPLGEACSLSIHESQSRLWENCIGRSRSFWKFHYPSLQQYFPKQLGNVSDDQFYKAINKVTPSLIRTEADEITYHFHVMIRYEIEKKLIEGSLKTKDIPYYWNKYYEEFLGVVVPDDKRGCLQDVHWSHGSFGYFATYSIGSLYAAQFFKTMNHENDLSGEIARGNTLPVFHWLQKHIYPSGRYYQSADLCRQCTGEILNTGYFLQYAKEKFYDIYS